MASESGKCRSGKGRFGTGTLLNPEDLRDSKKKKLMRVRVEDERSLKRTTRPKKTLNP